VLTRWSPQTVAHAYLIGLTQCAMITASSARSEARSETRTQTRIHGCAVGSKIGKTTNFFTLGLLLLDQGTKKIQQINILGRMAQILRLSLTRR
jgi:hypothetical protein